MEGDDFGRMIYLVLLGLAVLGWFFAQNRQKLNKTLQQVILWLILFAGVIALYGLKDELRDGLSPRSSVHVSGDRIELSRANDQHFYATLTINGQDVVFVVDTGATDIVLSKADAQLIGFDLDELAYFGTAQTANGEVRSARVKLKTIEFGPHKDRNVTAWVNEGELFGSLLGMSYLSKFSRFEIIGNKLYLTR